MQHVFLIGYNLRRVTTVCNGLSIALIRVVSAGHSFFAILLQSCLTIFAGAARIHHHTNTGQLTYFEIFNVCAYPRYFAHDFVARHHRVHRISPLVARLVQITMTNATIQNFNLHIIRPQFSTIELKWCEWRGGTEGCVSFGWDHFILVRM